MRGVCGVVCGMLCGVGCAVGLALRVLALPQGSRQSLRLIVAFYGQYE